MVICCGPGVVHKGQQVNGHMGGKRWHMCTHLHSPWWEYTDLYQFAPD